MLAVASRHVQSPLTALKSFSMQYICPVMLQDHACGIMKSLSLLQIITDHADMMINQRYFLPSHQAWVISCPSILP